MHLPPEWVDLFSAFADAGARYLLVGGHAVGVHCRPRSTKDVDLWIGPEPEDVERAARALASFGVPADIVEALRTSGPDDIVWMGRPPLRVDFLRSLPGVTFEQAWARRIRVTVDGISLEVIGKEDLITNKQTVGRPQDRRDVRALLGGDSPRRPRARKR